MIWLLVPLAALLWRVRGGLVEDLTGVANWHGLNDTVVRLIWAIGLTCAYTVLQGPFPLPTAPGYLVLMVALFASTTVVGWFGADVDLNHLNVKEAALVTLSGVLRMAFVSAALVSPWPLLAGLLCGPLYKLGSKLPKTALWQVWGEFLFGAAVGLSLVLTAYFPIHL